MARKKRETRGGIIYHVLNRCVPEFALFRNDLDYLAFARLMGEAANRYRVRVLAWCLMPNHWHAVLWPREDGDLSRFCKWLGQVHTQQVHALRGTKGRGHIYQGRFESIPVQPDGHFLRVCRYVERNALRARLVQRAEDWRWGSLWWWVSGREMEAWPVERSPEWVERVNRPMNQAEEAALRNCLAAKRPFGSDRWLRQMR